MEMHTMVFEPLDKNYVQKVRSSFQRQKFMEFIGARLAEVHPGYCEIHLPYKKELSQQHGFFHAGVIGTLADNSGGYAAFTLMPPRASILTVEYKLNILAPGDGELLIARAQVIKAGRTLTICRPEVFVVKDGYETMSAAALMTLIALPGKSDRPRPHLRS
ncbi:MAG: hypothetical protein AVO38_04615 [delta proteobacterium ML8_D]|jgi:uncharacterized protein (TIGR00369 family)|nr:MAG: hypothetical protein AVO38_04615 [delta proteobacterium ML8_D]